MTDSFPRLNARTQRFTLGRPRSVAVAGDPARVAFLRAPGPEDPATQLWVYDDAGGERLVADPATLLGSVAEDLPAEERARRERARETAQGIVGFAVDRAGRLAAFALSARLFVADLDTAAVRRAARRPVPWSTPGRTRAAAGSATSRTARCTWSASTVVTRSG